MVDHRAIATDCVGVRKLRHPVQARAENSAPETRSSGLEMPVALVSQPTCTHLPRFLEVLQGSFQMEEVLRVAVYGFLKDAPEGVGPFISGKAGQISGFSA